MTQKTNPSSIGRNEMNLNLKYVLIILGAALLIGIGGIIALAATASSVPDVLQNVVVGCLTALAGLLVQDKPNSVVQSGGPTIVDAGKDNGIATGPID